MSGRCRTKIRRSLSSRSRKSSTILQLKWRGPRAKFDSEAFKALETNVSKHYKAPLLPTMSTGATDMAYLRGKGIQCYGIGPATDVEDGPLGFGAHSDQERVLESEILRFAHFNWDLITDLARAR